MMHDGKVNIDLSSSRRRAQVMAVWAFLAFMGRVLPLAAQSDNLQQPSRIGITGTTSIYGKWACEGPARVDAALGDPLPPVSELARGIRVVKVTVDVGKIECHSGTLNKSLRKALKEKDHPRVRFNVQKYEFKNNGDTANVSGEFMIAGVGRPVEFVAKLTPVLQGGVQIRGGLEILMTDYGIKPPKALLGMMRVRDKITIQFDIFTPSYQMAISENKH